MRVSSSLFKVTGTLYSRPSCESIDRNAAPPKNQGVAEKRRDKKDDPVSHREDATDTPKCNRENVQLVGPPLPSSLLS